MKQRRPRPPVLLTGLPDTYAAALEDRIIKTVAKWREVKGEELTDIGSHNVFERFFFETLSDPHVASDSVDAIVRMAREGHPSADRALRHLIIDALGEHRYPQLHLAIQAYQREALAKAPLDTGYPSQAPQVLNTLTRNWGICYCMDRVKARYPEIPLLHKTKQFRSAAALVAEAFGLKEVQARRIYAADRDLLDRLTDFFVVPRKESFGAIPFV